jgi:hypothetical protein
VTPDQQDDEEQVRRVLGASAGPTPMPDEVKVRLDTVLADLVAERSAHNAAGTGASVVSLSDRRRHRWPQALVAAAVISVVALGVGGVLKLTGNTSNGGSAASAPAADSAQAGRAYPRELAPVQPSATRAPDSSAAKGAPFNAFDPAVGRLHTSSLGADVRRLVRLASVRGKLFGYTPRSPADGSLDSARASCELPTTRKGDQLYAVRLDGRRATLLLAAPGAGARVAQVYSCDEGSVPEATTTLPAN